MPRGQCSTNDSVIYTAAQKTVTELYDEDHRSTHSDNVPAPTYEQPDGSIADLLNELLTADEVHCEVPFCRQTAGETIPVLSNGVMDVICRKNGQWYIVDYKTNEDASDLAAKCQGAACRLYGSVFRADRRARHCQNLSYRLLNT